MHHRIIEAAIIAAALLASASLSFAAENKPVTTGEAGKTTEKQAKAAAPAKLVDINSAYKAELKKLPGIGDTEADKIIAGRPYLTKARLVTHNIISAAAYGNLKNLVIATQKPDIKAKPAKSK